MADLSLERTEHAILTSWKSGVAIALKVRDQPQLVTVIENVTVEGARKLVHLKSETLYGVLIEKTLVDFSDIEKAFLLYVNYYDPVYVKLREVKKLIKKL